MMNKKRRKNRYLSSLDIFAFNSYLGAVAVYSSEASDDLQKKHLPLLVPETISASKHRLISTNPPAFESYKSLSRKPLKVTVPSKVKRAPKMQELQVNQLEKELEMTKERLRSLQEERDHVLGELKEMKKAVSTSGKVSEVFAELKSARASLSVSTDELKGKEKIIESLRRDLEKAKAWEKRVQELEAEVKMGNESERRTIESLTCQTKQLEQTKMFLEESRIEIAALKEKTEFLAELTQHVKDYNILEILKSELKIAKENLGNARERETRVTLKAQSLLNEIVLLKNELNAAIEAEENSKQAMDDLALALKEVAMEASTAKEKLHDTQVELEQTKEEAESLRIRLKSTEEKYHTLLDEANQYRNTVERLRIEADETLSLWNEKENGFLSCVKKVEEERTVARQENKRLIDALIASEKITKAAKEETQKMRDILKQALNEANVAKEAAGIAKAENSQLKDNITEKDGALNFLTQEYESLKASEAHAQESIKELKKMLTELSSRESKKEQQQMGKHRRHSSLIKSPPQKDNLKKIGKAFSFDASKGDAIKGSVFEATVDLSNGAAANPRRKFSFSADNGDKAKSSRDFDHPDKNQNDEPGSQKKSSLLRRFSDLMKRRSASRKDLASSTE